MALYHWVMDTEAWRSLDTNARCAYVFMARRYAGPGSNNGMIPCSVREIADDLGIGKTTAQRALDALQDRGFIVLARQGGFNIKHRHASEYLLTEFKDDRPGKGLELPHKTFANWRKSEHGTATGTHRYPQRNRSVPAAGQLQKVTMAYGTATGTEPTNDGAATGTPLVCQGEAELSEPTEAAPPMKEAPPSKGARHRNGQAGGVILDSPSRSGGPVHVSETLKGLLGISPVEPPSAQIAAIECKSSLSPADSEPGTDKIQVLQTAAPEFSSPERILLRWLQSFASSCGETPTHRKAQQNLSGQIKGDAIVEAAALLAERGMIRIGEKGRSRVYILLDAGRDPRLVHEDDGQVDLVDWLEGAPA